jgi:hypothetical protein
MINPRTDLNDSLDDLIGRAGDEVRTAPVLDRPAAQAYTSTTVQTFSEPCKKCRGTGRFISYSGRTVGNCFTCKGAGKFERKTSPEVRAARRENAVQKRAQADVAALDAFRSAHPQIWAWINAETAKDHPFAFATSMVEAIIRYGDLTAGQLAACQRLVDKAAAKVEARVEAIQNAPQVDTAGVDRLKQAFDKARAYTAAKATGLTLRNPKITIGGMTISPAKASSANAGALYVKQGQDYLGKIMNGKFMAVAACSPAQRDQVLAFVADPAAKAYGQETGVCCVCNATLKSKWRLRGIGPVCAEKMGWAGLAEDFGVDL